MRTSLRRGIVWVPTTFHEVNRPDGENDSKSCAADRKNNALGQILTQETGATGADRDTDRHLAFARTGSRQKHGGEIGAGNEKDERDRA